MSWGTYYKSGFLGFTQTYPFLHEPPQICKRAWQVGMQRAAKQTKMQPGSPCQKGWAEMTQQVRTVTLYFWSHYSGSYPVATTNAHARIGLTPEPSWEQHRVAIAIWLRTRAGFSEESQPQVLVDNQLPNVGLRTPTKRLWSTPNLSHSVLSKGPTSQGK